MRIAGTGRRPPALPTDFDGLHPGARLRVGPGGARAGAVGWLLERAGGLWLVTAGHLFPPGATGAEATVWAGSAGGGMVPVGTLARSLLDLPDPVDAALVRLDPAGVALARPGARAVAAPRPGAPVRLLLPPSGRPTVALPLRSGPWRGRLGAPGRPDVVLREALRVLPPVSRDGDSGAPWVDADGAIVGLTLGVLGAETVGIAAEAVMRALR